MSGTAHAVTDNANAFILGLSISDTSPEQGGEISFTLSVDIQTNERLPVDNLILNLSKLDGSFERLCLFDKEGNVISGCEGMSIELISIGEEDTGNLLGVYDGTEYNFGYGSGFSNTKLTYMGALC